MAELRKCQNCKTHLPDEAYYCPNCGQKYREDLPTFLEVVSDFFSNLLNLNFQVFPTLRDLLIPAKLSLRYSVGMRKKYVSPGRLFVLSIILFIFIGTLFVTQDDVSINGLEAFQKKAEKYVENQEKETVADSIWQKLDTQQDIPAEVVDSFRVAFFKLHVTSNRDTNLLRIDLSGICRKDVVITLDSMAGDSGSVVIDAEEYLSHTPEELLEIHDIDFFWDQLIVRQMLRLLSSRQNLTLYLIRQLLWATALLLPLFALWLKLVYYRRGYYYVEHLVFLAHLHAFTYIWVSLLILVPENSTFWDMVERIGFIALGLYWVVAFWRFYRQHLLKWVVKMFLSTVVYCILLVLVILIGVVIGFLLLGTPLG